MSYTGQKLSEVPVLWRPKENPQLQKLMKSIEEKYKTQFAGFRDFHQWTVEHLSEFWGEIWDYAGLIYSENYHKIIDVNIPLSESPKWFEGAKLNFAENLLKYRDDHVALILTGEDVETSRITYAQLYEEARLYAAAFRKVGIQKGDVVMCYMSNRKEAVLGMLTAVSIGALWTGALPLMGPEAVLNRISQVNPKLLLTVDRYMFNNEEIEMLTKVEKIAKGLPSLQKVVVVPSREESKKKDIIRIKNGCFLDEFLALGRREDGSVPEMEFEQVSMSYPVFIHFTSGTTGLPKALLHGSGLLLMQTVSNSVQLNVGRDDVLLSLSPVGWASWTYFATLLSKGLSVVLHEGSPYLLTPTSIWDLIDEFQVTHMMITAAVTDELEKRRYLPTKKHSMKSLKSIMSGGSVVKLNSYDFVYKEMNLDVLFASCYGCTECMILSSLEYSLPVHRGELQTTLLGLKMETYDENTGQPIEGEVGELVIATPTPGLLIGMWDDEDGTKMREKYFSKYPGKFLVGDYGILNPITKGVIICGRCDETLKQRGCRFGSSEIYNVVTHFSEVHDSICVSQYNKDMDERAVLFLKMSSGHSFSEDLVKRIKKRIAQDLTPRHVPDVILETGEIPFNTNNKKMEITVKKIINKMPCNIDAIVNPLSLKFYQNRPELQGDF